MILDKIIETKKQEVAENKVKNPEKKLTISPFFERGTFSLKNSLLQPGSSGIIAEFKLKSPSKGIINSTATVEEVCQAYVSAGASALSVLTDEQYFGGCNAFLTQARKLNTCPILRKDFIIDEYQIVEAKSIGADAILLIAAALTKERCKQLAVFAKSLGLEILFEIHGKDELEYLIPEFDVVGVNNRNLQTFVVSLSVSEVLSTKIPKGVVKISESGINYPEDIRYLRNFGYQGFLIGENFMKTANPGEACREFIKEIKK